MMASTGDDWGTKAKFIPSDRTLVSSAVRVRLLRLTTVWLTKAALELRWALVWSWFGGTEQPIGLEYWGRRDIDDPIAWVEMERGCSWSCAW